MKRFLVLCLLLALTAGMAFADDDEEDEDSGRKLIYFQVGAGLMYKQPLPSDFAIWNFRIGVTGDLLFSLGFIELGAEIGAYAFEMEDYYGTFMILEMPLDALIRINFDDDRRFAIEAFGGAWFIMAGYSSIVTEIGLNFGARLVMSWFYIGGEYVMTEVFYPAWVVEAGVKFSF